MIAEKAALRREKRAQDTARFVEEFFALTGFRPSAAYREFLPPEFLAQPVPSPAELAARFGGRLLTRTSNALRQQDPGPADLEGWNFDRLRRLRGCGVFCLLDVMRALHESGLALAPASAADPTTAR